MFLFSVGPAQGAGAAGGAAQIYPACAQIAFQALVEGQWDIVVLDVARREMLRLSGPEGDEAAPAFSPDGARIAYASRRAGNWDVYSRDLATGAERRLTNSPAYDGRPAFSPDGARIAFESSREGDPDIYLMPANGGAQQALLTDRAAEVEPVWTADGQGLIVGSWRSGARQLLRYDLATEALTPLSEPGEEAQQAALSPDGGRLAYLSIGDSVTRLLVRDLASGAVAQAGGAGQWPAWSDDGLLSLELVGAGAYNYPSGWRLATHGEAESTIGALVGRLPALPGQWQQPSCAPAGAARARGDWQPLDRALVRWLALEPGNRPPANPPRGAEEVPNVDAPAAVLATPVARSFGRLRTQVADASGYDFMSVFGDIWRTLGNQHGSLTSWHKAGRAFDVRHGFAAGGQRRLYITRQVLGDQTYFRVYLLAQQQDGSQGAPLRESVWEVIGRRSDPQVVREGGYALPPPVGYFVDFTDLAEREGWTRISGLTPPDGNWRDSYDDIEFWHYERRDGLRFHTAMRLLYPDERLRQFYDPGALLAQGYAVEQLVRAGIPGARQAECRRAAWDWLGRRC